VVRSQCFHNVVGSFLFNVLVVLFWFTLFTSLRLGGGIGSCKFCLLSRFGTIVLGSKNETEPL
jgi:hypothetical protein